MRAVSGGPALVIPIKATLGAKQRLSSRLGSEERRMLALAMAGDTLRVAGRAVQRSRCVVVAGDAEVARLAARHEMAVVRERGAGQSAALRAGVAWAVERGHTAVVTIAADCAMLDIDDLHTLMERALRRGRFLLCAPDAEGKGTNAAVLRPLDIDIWRFGPNSLERHRAAAEAAGLRFEVLDLPSLRIDCDRPEDLVGVISQPRPTATFHVLRQLGLAGRRAVG
jgi:2-phospho-L-lactate/phosphoenolpyruvate guanylyltransferase